MPCSALASTDVECFFTLREKQISATTFSEIGLAGDDVNQIGFHVNPPKHRWARKIALEVCRMLRSPVMIFFAVIAICFSAISAFVVPKAVWFQLRGNPTYIVEHHVRGTFNGRIMGAYWTYNGTFLAGGDYWVSVNGNKPFRTYTSILSIDYYLRPDGIQPGNGIIAVPGYNLDSTSYFSKSLPPVSEVDFQKEYGDYYLDFKGRKLDIALQSEGPVLDVNLNGAYRVTFDGKEIPNVKNLKLSRAIRLDGYNPYLLGTADNLSVFYDANHPNLSSVSTCTWFETYMISPSSLTSSQASVFSKLDTSNMDIVGSNSQGIDVSMDILRNSPDAMLSGSATSLKLNGQSLIPNLQQWMSAHLSDIINITFTGLITTLFAFSIRRANQ